LIWLSCRCGFAVEGGSWAVEVYGIVLGGLDIEVVAVDGVLFAGTNKNKGFK